MKDDDVEKLFENIKLQPMDLSTPEGKKLKKDCAAIGANIKQLFEKMKEPKQLPVPAVNAVMWLLGDMLSTDMVRVAVTPQAKTVKFLMTGEKEDRRGMVLVPANWLDLMNTIPTVLMGGLAYVASEAKDFYNDRLKSEVDIAYEKNCGKNAVVCRSLCHEAELYLWLSKNDSEFSPNEYQAKIMGEYPNGIGSIPEGLRYEPKPFWPDWR